MKSVITLLLILYSSSIYAEIFKCIDEAGKVTFSDKSECQDPDEIKITTRSPAEELRGKVKRLRASSAAVNLAFDINRVNHPVMGYFEGFYVVNPDNIYIFLDKVTVTRKGYVKEYKVNLRGISFIIYGKRIPSSTEDDVLQSNTYKISHSLKPDESVVYNNIELIIPTKGYTKEMLSRYRLTGSVAHGNTNTMYLTNDFLRVDLNRRIK